VADDADYCVRFAGLAGLRGECLHRHRQIFEKQDGVADRIAIAADIDRWGCDEKADYRAGCAELGWQLLISQAVFQEIV
jgi:hypothetical protein